ncbi:MULTISPECIES: flagellar export protein FliJ [unclassified Methylophaga]|jgi:flagellar FliJ protein|uniref:flagellar export protein FliJ n=1 Tax=unclassified Methylophaga TaxID=2629249 RepID=UPI000C94F548|nr:MULTISPECIES: flagellar export protein FliJ [unclassified Methylophaga]MAK67440.1 flagellar export protein FliJ [Methylophaga sp.]MAY16980.1 flagellar export protein FliJ [Methylophaga sp.]HAO26081.1 flagellar export protein FliJ [Methylophaga sp.]HCD05275.1 flagellar export protein FliJ [Methylophaga sp.]|tara:strand:- start:25281 stop:25724 length:444 start_codon:yes stop_codon:yes gene_type:complete
MTRATKLNPVIEMAGRDTDKAMQDLVQANNVLDQERHQLNDLLRYREEYLQQFRQGDALQMSARKAIDLRNFLAQLDQAIRLQQSQVERCFVQTQKQQQRWLEARNKQRSIESLKDRYQNEAEQRQQKLEQRLADEHTAMLWARRHK